MIATKFLAAASGIPTELTYLENQFTTGLTQSESFTNVSFGSEQSGRYILVVVHSWGASNDIDPDSCSIGGESGAETGPRISENSGSYANVSLFYAQPSGTSGTVSVTFSSDVQGVGIGVFKLVTEDVDNHDFEATSVAGTLSIDVPEGGAILAYCSVINNSVADLITTGSPTTAYSIDVDTNDYMKAEFQSDHPGGTASVDGANNNATVAFSWK